MDKGPATRLAIVDEAIRQAAHVGLTGISLGRIAAELRMSKGGVSRHFASKAELQLAVVARSAYVFDTTVVVPVLSRTEGADRLMALFGRYLDWIEDDGLDAVVARELDALPDEVATMFREHQAQWRRAVVAVADQAVGSERAEEVALQFVGLALAFRQGIDVFGETGARREVEAVFERATTGAWCPPPQGDRCRS